MVKHKKYTVNDIAYVQGMEMINKKIDELAVQTNLNYNIVDEVNGLLKEYVLKTDMPEQADLSDYVLKSESEKKLCYTCKTFN